MKYLVGFLLFTFLLINNLFAEDNYVNNSLQRKDAKELINKRNRFSKTYQNSDGSYTVIINAIPMHEKDIRGYWTEINSSTNKLETTQTSDPYNGEYYCVYYDQDLQMYLSDGSLFNAGKAVFQNYIYESTLKTMIFR